MVIMLRSNEQAVALFS